MQPAIQSVRSATSLQWDAIWKDCETATYFHSREWAEIWQAYSSGFLRPDPLLVEFSDGKRALLPLLCKRRWRGLVKSWVSSAAATYGGWIAADALDERHADLLGSFLTRGIGNVVWKTNPFDRLSTAFAERVPEYREGDETQVLDLGQGFAALRRRFTRGHRNAANKARRLGVEVRVASRPEEWDEYYEVFLDSVKRWGKRAFSVYRRELFEEMRARNSPSIELRLAVHSGVIVAGLLLLYAKEHVSCWHGAALEERFALRPVHLLFSEAMRSACERGFTWFDLGSSGPLEGVRGFKKGFQPRVLPCPSIRNEAAWLRLSRSIQKVVSAPAS